MLIAYTKIFTPNLRHPHCQFIKICFFTLFITPLTVVCIGIKQRTLETHQTRFACKTFESSKTIEKEDLEFILEVARLSPSSVGLEPWKFMVVQEKTLREKLKPLCWNQNQITDASELIVILSRTKENLFEQGYIKKHYEARGYSPDFYNSSRI